jgi:hypothetical protein
MDHSIAYLMEFKQLLKFKHWPEFIEDKKELPWLKTPHYQLNG